MTTNEDAQALTPRWTTLLVPLATVVLGVYVVAVSVLLLPVYKAMLQSMQVEVPWAARVVTNDSVSMGMVFIFLAWALAWMWWRQPHVRARFPMRMMTPRAVLSVINFVLVLAVLAQGTIFLRFATDGVRELSRSASARTSALPGTQP